MASDYTHTTFLVTYSCFTLFILGLKFNRAIIHGFYWNPPLNNMLVDVPFAGNVGNQNANIVLVDIDHLAFAVTPSEEQNREIEISMPATPTEDEREFYSRVTKKRAWLNYMFENEDFVLKTLDDHLTRLEN